MNNTDENDDGTSTPDFDAFEPSIPPRFCRKCFYEIENINIIPLCTLCGGQNFKKGVKFHEFD